MLLPEGRKARRAITPREITLSGRRDLGIKKGTLFDVSSGSRRIDWRSHRPLCRETARTNASAKDEGRSVERQRALTGLAGFDSANNSAWLWARAVCPEPSRQGPAFAWLRRGKRLPLRRPIPGKRELKELVNGQLALPTGNSLNPTIFFRTT